MTADLSVLLDKLKETEEKPLAMIHASTLVALVEVAQAAATVQAARDWEQPKHFAEFVDVLDVEGEALARLRRTLAGEK